MKILFLDIDGVVNSEESFKKGVRFRGVIGIDPHMAFRVGKITLEVPDLKVVLSSSWRYGEENREEVRRAVVDFIDITPLGRDASEVRGHEIKRWLDMHPEVTRYAILDDDSDMLPEQLPNFFQTSWKTGITDEIMNKVIEHFNKEDVL